MSKPTEEQPGESGGKVLLGRGAWAWREKIRWSFSRSRGPGGQAVNKISTKAELRISVLDIEDMDEEARRRLRAMAGKKLTNADEVVISADVERSQLANREACLERLRVMVGSAMKRPRVRKKTKPPASVKRKRLEGKRIRGEIKSGRKGGNWEE
ncbi:MAG TPA: alternative ribosome rescue aminoacyl-tRNA hydrolase ArfB [Phycisphaerales bacterium]|nr:alternative ribosome rescue aminoacyl-tRNA hydrolase ArfB [Phycisphaerales bacterium]